MRTSRGRRGRRGRPLWALTRAPSSNKNSSSARNSGSSSLAARHSRTRPAHVGAAFDRLDHLAGRVIPFPAARRRHIGQRHSHNRRSPRDARHHGFEPRRSARARRVIRMGRPQGASQNASAFWAKARRHSATSSSFRGEVAIERHLCWCRRPSAYFPRPRRRGTPPRPVEQVCPAARTIRSRGGGRGVVRSGCGRGRFAVFLGMAG